VDAAATNGVGSRVCTVCAVRPRRRFGCAHGAAAPRCRGARMDALRTGTVQARR
jgi:hypothetical protein